MSSQHTVTLNNGNPPPPKKFHQLYIADSLETPRAAFKSSSLSQNCRESQQCICCRTATVFG